MLRARGSNTAVASAPATTTATATAASSSSCVAPSANKSSTKTKSKSTVKHASAASKKDSKKQNEKTKKQQQQQAQEQPTPNFHLIEALADAQYPRKRRNASAFDDRLCERQRTSFLNMPWDDEQPTGIEKPDYSVQNMAPLRLALRDRNNNSSSIDDTAAFVARMSGQVKEQDAIKALGVFARVPVEIRDKILRHLMVQDVPIRVLAGWSIVFPRSRPNFHIAVMRTCRVFYHESVRILYGENCFEYLVRDPSAARHDTSRMTKAVFEHDSIPIERHGHLIRNIKLVVEANRACDPEMRDYFADAIVKFLPGGGLCIRAQHKLQEIPGKPLKTRYRKEMPAMELISPGTPGFKALKVLNCQFIRIVAHGDNARHFECLIDRRAHFTELGAASGELDDWRNDKVMLEMRRNKAKKSNSRLNGLWYWIEGLQCQPMTVLARAEWIREFIPEALSSITRQRKSRPNYTE